MRERESVCVAGFRFRTGSAVAFFDRHTHHDDAE